MGRYNLTPQYQTNRGMFYGLWIAPIKSVKLTSYVIKEGDRLDLLAQRFLNDAKLWWVIAYINRIFNPFKLMPGQVINVPVSIEFYET